LSEADFLEYQATVFFFMGPVYELHYRQEVSAEEALHYQFETRRVCIMKRRILYWTVTTACALLLMASPRAMAGGHGEKGGSGMHQAQGHGKQHGEKAMHHGWDKGKKKGWKSDVPSGHEMKGEKAVTKGTPSGEQAVEQMEQQKDKAMEGAEKTKREVKKKSEKHREMMENESGKAKKTAVDLQQPLQ